MSSITHTMCFSGYFLLLTKICMLDIDLHVLNLVDLDSFIGTKIDYHIIIELMSHTIASTFLILEIKKNYCNPFRLWTTRVQEQ